MDLRRKFNGFLKSVFCFVLAFAACVAVTTSARAESEETFDVLQIGTRLYRNVTVTTKAKGYIFIMHSAGMANIKVSELPPNLREKLGYGAPAADAGKNTESKASAWAKKTAASIEIPQLKQIEQKLGGHGASGLAAAAINSNQFMYLLGGIVIFYFLVSYCFLLICKKAGKPAGPIIWVPFAQMIPLLDAAGMSGWWFIGFMLPVINVVGSILWCFKIAKACGKGAGTGLMLLLPVINILALFYLAFSGGGASREDKPRVEIMTLETA